MKLLAGSRIVGAAALLIGGLGQIAIASPGTWEATLQGRDLNQDGITDAFYDTVLDITWLKDWNLAKTSKFAGANANGGMNWIEAKHWAESLTFGGFSDWRLPGIRPVNGLAFDYRFSTDGSTDIGYSRPGQGWGDASEIGHLYYVTLGHAAFSPEVYASNSDNRPFENMATGSFYWIDALYAVDPSRAFRFWNTYGEQGHSLKSLDLYAVAVRNGDVAPIPEPTTLASFIAGMLCLVLFRSAQTIPGANHLK